MLLPIRFSFLQDQTKSLNGLVRIDLVLEMGYNVREESNNICKGLELVRDCERKVGSFEVDKTSDGREDDFILTCM